MKQLYIIAALLVAFSAAQAQTTPQVKKTFKVYYVPFTEQEYLVLQKQVIHADSLLSVSDAKAKEIIPAKDVINNLFSAFIQSYVRQDTLQLRPLQPPVAKK